MPTPLLFYVRPALAGLALLATTSAFAGCAAPAGDDGATGDDSALTRTANDHWFYAGPLPTLESPHVFVSLEGSTARLSGLLPDGVTLAEVPPHVKLKTEGTRTRVDAVYPIATARAGKSNARPGDYRMNNVIPYRPDGIAVTVEEGEHQVPWGGPSSVTTAASRCTDRSPSPTTKARPTSPSGICSAAKCPADATA